MKYFSLLMILLPTLSLASMFTECGEYSVKGVVRSGQTSFNIIVNEKTQSEHVIDFLPSESQKIGAFVNRPIEAVVLLDKKFNGTIGVGQTIISAKFRIPDPLNPKDTGFSLIKKVECRKN